MLTPTEVFYIIIGIIVGRISMVIRVCSSKTQEKAQDSESNLRDLSLTASDLRRFLK